MPPVPAQRSSLASLFLRIFWMILGPVLVFALSGLIAQRGGYSIVDVWFAAVVAIVLFARLLDIRKFAGETSGGEPATMSHFWGYSLKLLMAATGVWLIAHLLPSTP
jgi:hypothetical protein